VPARVYSMEDTLAGAVAAYYLDRSGQPELIPLGFPPVDAELGGLGPATCGILAAATGVGKSSAVLAGSLAAPVKTGIISLEDGPDVVGARVLAHLTGVNSRHIRRKQFADKRDLVLVNEAAKQGEPSHVFFAYPHAKMAPILEAVEALAARGCRLIWLDYLQKVRGHGADRRNEVGATYTEFQQACKTHDVAGMAVSQFRRLSDGEKVPQIHHLKESGDLENEARLIILAHKYTSEHPGVGSRVRFRVAKSVFGGEEIEFDYLRDDAGSLQYAEFFKAPEAPLPGAEINF